MTLRQYLLLAALTSGLLMTGCLSQQEVDKFNGRFMSRDSRLVRTTVDEMVAHKDQRFVKMAAAYLQDSPEVRRTPPLPDPVEARVEGAVRLLLRCAPRRARRMLNKELSPEPSPNYRLPRWALRLASAMDSPDIWKRLYRLYRDDRLRHYERRDIGEVLLGAGVEQFATDIRWMARKPDGLSVEFLARSATPGDIELLLWCMENVPTHQEMVVAAIGRTKAKKGLAALLNMAGSESWRDWTVAEALARALGEYSDTESATVLRKLAATGRREVRIAAQRALVTRGDTAYTEALYRRLTEARSPAAADHIIKEFREDGTPACLDMLRRHVREKSTDAWPLSALALTELGDAKAKATLAACLVKDPKKVEPLFRIPYFQRLATPAGFDLLLAMASRDQSNRHILVEEVRRLLAKTAGAELAEAISAGLRHSNPLAREACVVWLLAVKKTEAMKMLRPMLNDPSPGVRHRVLQTLAAVPDDDVKTEFRRISKESPDPVARRIVVSAMGQWRDTDLIPDLQAALKDRDPYVRANAMTALAQLDTDQAGPAASAMLNDPYLHVRSEAIRCATTLKLAAAADGILPFLKHRNPQVRSLAVEFFRAVPDERSIPAIVAGLKGRSLAERQTALRTIIALKATSAADAMLEMLAGEPDYLTRDVLRYFAVCRDTRCVPRLLEILTKQKYARWHPIVIKTLGWQKDDRAVKTLGSILNAPDKTSLRREAAIALFQMATPNASAVVTGAGKSKNPAIRQAVEYASRYAKRKD